MQLYLDGELQKYFSKDALLFDQIMALSGQRFRGQNGRVTERVCLGNQYYFIKKHSGVGWMEIIKNILQFRLPIISAKNEWQALKKLRELAIDAPKVVGFGQRGFNPARKQAFVIMEEVSPMISLEELTRNWQTSPPAFTYKNKLIAKVAEIARDLHHHGINHRDFYICHFLLDTSSSSSLNCYDNPKIDLKLFLIDLHRAHIRAKTPKRWQIKDLAGLYFSSKDIGLTRRDYLRFMSLYRGISWRKILVDENKFWHKVKVRGDRLYQRHQHILERT